MRRGIPDACFGFARCVACVGLLVVVAAAREKQIKAGSRADKIMLIRESNPEWNDLYDSL